MTHPTEPRVEVTQADEELGLKLWRVHPDEILAQGTTRPQWYAQEIARHRTAAEAVSREEVERLRNAALDALAGWRYIRQHHGDLYGVGWDRVEDALTAALSPTATGEGGNG